MKNLVIVESPSKSHTIEKYLGKDFKVISSMGHIRDLATSGKYGLGVDVEDNFAPNYTAIKGKKKLITDLKKQVSKYDHVYLATDPDREGEAISWHLYDVLELNDDNYDRIVFNEITKNKVLDSFNYARKIDYDLVHSQESRRILDRIMGFRLSKVMQSKIGSKSAGRVQSVALKLIVDREREIEAFKSEEYWTITAFFDDFDAGLEKYHGKDVKIEGKVQADEIINQLSKTFNIDGVTKKDKAKKSKVPYITSTLQQESSTKLGFTGKKTMSIAQKLYEGIELSNETVGLITYMRTDSIRLSNEFMGATYKYIEKNYGKEYIGHAKISKKTENVQDAHEAIRPTSIDRTPESVKKYLSNDEYKLYSLIYYRALASLMSDAKAKQTTIILENNGYTFKTTGSIITFDGYLKVYSSYEASEDKILPDFENLHINKVISKSIEPKQHFTQPPARYSEAKLIQALEELGIGRPSTYAKIIETLIERTYVEVLEKRFKPTPIGIETTDALQQFFSSLINVEYTAEMERELDQIADGELVWYDMLQKFYDSFMPTVDNALKNMEKKKDEETGELCPNCNSPMVVKRSKYGTFEACSNYPTCKYIKQDEKKTVAITSCPNCDGDIIEKKSKRGKVFYGCNNYPKCKTAYWDKPIGKKCPECGEMLVETKKNQVKCSACSYKE